MAQTYNMHEAKTHLSRLAERAAQGEEIVIARNGQALAKLVPIDQRKPRTLGLWKERVWVSDDFDAPLPTEIQGDFEGR
jgi:prevent-host-death family protein